MSHQEKGREPLIRHLACLGIGMPQEGLECHTMVPTLEGASCPQWQPEVGQHHRMRTSYCARDHLIELFSILLTVEAQRHLQNL